MAQARCEPPPVAASASTWRCPMPPKCGFRQYELLSQPSCSDRHGRREPRQHVHSNEVLNRTTEPSCPTESDGVHLLDSEIRPEKLEYLLESVLAQMAVLKGFVA